ncbi:MAG: hypothetical protein M0000_08730 [Actinomycetota bacterium]|nr:hypothetical protein [Actinomycetota bacterium]
MMDLFNETSPAAPLAQRRFVRFTVLDESQRNVVRQDILLEVEHVDEGLAAPLADPDRFVHLLAVFLWFHAIASTRRLAGLLFSLEEKPDVTTSALPVNAIARVTRMPAGGFVTS